MRRAAAAMRATDDRARRARCASVRRVPRHHRARTIASPSRRSQRPRFAFGASFARPSRRCEQCACFAVRRGVERVIGRALEVLGRAAEIAGQLPVVRELGEAQAEVRIRGMARFHGERGAAVEVTARVVGELRVCELAQRVVLEPQLTIDLLDDVPHDQLGHGIACGVRRRVRGRGEHVRVTRTAEHRRGDRELARIGGELTQPAPPDLLHRARRRQGDRTQSSSRCDSRQRPPGSRCTIPSSTAIRRYSAANSGLPSERLAT